MELPATIAVSAPSGVLIAGLAIIGIVLVMRSTRRRVVRSQARSVPPVRQRYAQLTREHHAARSLEQVMAEMDELARQIHGRLDTKIARLEALIRDADERLTRMSRLQERRADAAPGLDVTLDSESPLGVRASTVECETPDRMERAANDVDPTYTRACALADRGLSCDDIAADLSRPVGEIELILSLRKAEQGA